MAAEKMNFEGTIAVALGGTVAAGDMARVQDMVGLYMKGGDSSDVVPFLVQGYVKNAAKTTGATWTPGQALYWDNSATKFTTVVKNASPDAIAAVSAASGDAVGDVILLGKGKSYAASALTTQLTTITHTAPGTPDYAIQNLTNSNGYGFVTADEGNSVLKVIANLQARLSELETKLQAAGLLS